MQRGRLLNLMDAEREPSGLDQRGKTSWFRQGVRGDWKKKDSKTQILRINLELGGALLSDEEAGLQNYTNNLYYICLINKIKDYANIILLILFYIF